MLAEYKTTLDKKIERFREIQKRSDGNPLIALAIGEASFRRGLRLEALTAYQEVLREHAVPEAYMAIARIYAEQDMITEAYEELERLFAVDPHNVEARILGEELNEIQPAPETLLEFLAQPPYLDAVTEARRRLRLEKKILERQLQELTRNVAIDPKEAIHEYLMEEGKKRLSQHEATLLKVDKLENVAQKTLVAPPVPSEEPVSSQTEESWPEQDASPIEEPELSLDPPAVAEPVPGLEVSVEESLEQETAVVVESESVSDAVDAAATINDFALPEDDGGSVFESLPAGFASEEPLPISDMFLSEDPLALSELPLPKVNLEVGGEFPPLPEELDPLGVAEPVPAIEPETEPELESAPEPEPEVVAEVQPAEPELEPLPEAVVPAGPSAERLAFYESVSSQLSELTATLSKTRGVTSTFLVTAEGSVLEHSANPEIAVERIGDTVVEGLDFLTAFAANPQYWVLECNGGIFVMQTVDPRHVLVAIGQAGANFGALRYTMDKTRSKFADILTQAPE